MDNNNFFKQMIHKFKHDDGIRHQYNNVISTLLPNISGINGQIYNIERHYYKSCIAVESCCNYIINYYPQYKNNTGIRIHNLQTTMDYEWKQVELCGFNKKSLITTLYNQQEMLKEIDNLKSILWLLERDTTAITTVKRTLPFMEFYERRHQHKPRKNYRLILSEYL